ncbi:MAG TPA: outer membrane beta-barrel protein [Chitinivibrionales bacterium]|nr:outer membrane beta-barrel protein [Chitinivibrionales bacterium]
MKHALRLFCIWLALFSVSSFAQPLAVGGVPLRFSFALTAGASQSSIAADSLLASYFAPNASVVHIIGPAIGLDYEIRIGRFAAVSLGTEYQVRGENTNKTAVMFTDDIFQHDLATTAELRYLAFPLVVKGGYCGPAGWIYAKAGVTGSWLLGSTLKWLIDGREATPGSTHMPYVGIYGNDFGVLGGLEAGMSFGRHGFFVSGEYLYGLTSISSDLSGTAFNRATEVTVGYRFFISKTK